MSALDVDWLSLWAGFMLVAGVGAGWISRALIAERRAKASGPEETPAEPISTPESAAVGSGSREGDAAPPARLMVTPGPASVRHFENRDCAFIGCTPVEVSTDA